MWGARQRRDGLPFGTAVLCFVCAFLMLAVMFWPHMIPRQITVADAGAPEAWLRFLFDGAGIVVLPIVALYTVSVHWVFRGKLDEGDV